MYAFTDWFKSEKCEKNCEKNFKKSSIMELGLSDELPTHFYGITRLSELLFPNEDSWVQSNLRMWGKDSNVSDYWKPKWKQGSSSNGGTVLY